MRLSVPVRQIEDSGAFPLLGSIAYSFAPDARISLFGGEDPGERLRLENENGNLIVEEDHDSAPVLGVGFRFRLLDRRNHTPANSIYGLEKRYALSA